MPSIKQAILYRAKKAARNLLWQYRQATWRSRSLPDFIIIGAQKSGTSSLYKYLAQHPQLLPSYRKEIHFFDGGKDPDVDTYEKGQAWYRSHFPLIRHMNAHTKTFESSPLYIFNPLVPKRIYDLIPEVKIIAVLRNPTERAISHYFHEKRLNRESLPIYEALQEEEKRLDSAIKEKDYKSKAFVHYSYKSRGLYKEQTERYLKLFPWEQILILSSEEFFGNPEAILERVFDFLGVDQGFKVKDLKARNVGVNRVDVDSKVYQYLDDYFLPHNRALYGLIGKDFGWEN